MLNVLQPNPIRFTVSQPYGAGNTTILGLLNFEIEPSFSAYPGTGFDLSAFQAGAFQ